jgi:hypothetical protein
LPMPALPLQPLSLARIAHLGVMPALVSFA